MYTSITNNFGVQRTKFDAQYIKIGVQYIQFDAQYI
jgi:hypothetical protein